MRTIQLLLGHRSLATTSRYLKVATTTVCATISPFDLLPKDLHCVVPDGGLSADGERWISCRPGFFLPVRVLRRLFRRLFLTQLKGAFDAGRLRFFNALEPLQEPGTFAPYLAPLRQAEWWVYAKPPFGGPQHALHYADISIATRSGPSRLPKAAARWRLRTKE